MAGTANSNRNTYKIVLQTYPDVLNVSQMCEVLSISTKTGYKLLNEKKIESIKVGRSYKIAKVHILNYLKVYK